MSSYPQLLKISLSTGMSFKSAFESSSSENFFTLKSDLNCVVSVSNVPSY